MINTVAFEDKEIWSLAVRTLDGVRETYRATGNHPFWVEFVKGVEDKGGWTALELLEPGDQLRLTNGEAAFVDKVFDTGEIEAVYNMEVDGFHTYHVGELGVWVHNTNCGDLLPKLSRFESGQLRTIKKLVGFDRPTSTRKAVTMEQFEKIAQNFVGEGFVETVTTGRNAVRRLVSKDRLRQVRFPVSKSQVHLQTLQPRNSSDLVGNFQQRVPTDVGFPAYGSNVHVGVK